MFLLERLLFLLVFLGERLLLLFVLFLELLDFGSVELSAFSIARILFVAAALTFGALVPAAFAGYRFPPDAAVQDAGLALCRRAPLGRLAYC